MRRCAECRALLPKDAGPNRRYCDTTCRSRHWRHDEEIYQRAVYEGLQVIRGECLWAQGLCPVRGVSLSLRKRTDSVYCFPKCRSRAWRLRRETVGAAGDGSERPLPIS
ncbi:hypothetical protein ACWD4F_30885 [Streptomyces aureus]